jgi:hypothetical protein
MRNPRSTFWPTIILPIVVLTMVAFQSGCGQPPATDVTSSPEYNFSSFAGTIWKTKVNTALGDGREYTGVHHLYLLIPKHFDTTRPDYSPSADTRIVAVLKPGMRLQIGRLIKDNGSGGLLWVVGTLRDETNSQETVYLDPWLLAKNQFLFDGSSSTNWNVDPDMLEKL